MTFSLFIKASCCHPILILEIKANNQIERIRKVTAWGEVSKPQLTAWSKVNLQLLQFLREGWAGDACLCRGNAIVATLSCRKVLVNVDMKAFSLNVLIKYLEANTSSQLVSEHCFLVDKCFQQKLGWGFSQTWLSQQKAFAEALEIKEAVAIIKKQCGGRLV